MTMEPPRRAPKRWTDSKEAVWLTQLAVIMIAVGMWELAVRLHWISELRFGQPSRIVFHLRQTVGSGELWRHLKVTLYEEVSGFAIGTLLGTGIGLGLWWSRNLARVLEPFVVVFNGLPKVALAPPMIVWFGIFETSKIVLGALICLVVAWLSTYGGVRMVDRDLIEMIRAMGGNRWQAFAKVVVPASLPWILSAAKVNIGFALVGAVVGEFVASNHGLGFLAAQAGLLFQMSRLWMVISVIIVVASVQYGLVLQLERFWTRWAGSGRLRAAA